MVGRTRFSDPQLRMRRRQRCLFRRKQLLEELFAGPQPGKDDRDAVGISTREPDEITREIKDAHRLAHVEHQDFAVPALERSLEQKLRGLRQRHEEAGDVGMGHGHGAAARNLLPKAGNHASGAAEHIAESNQDELRARALEALADNLGEALGRAHHAGRIDGLVGGNQHEFLDLGRHRRAGEHPGAIGVVAHRLPGVGVLHQWHVLVRRGMKDDVGRLAVEDLFDQCHMLHIAHHGGERQLRKHVGERDLDLVERRLGDIEQHQLAGTESGNLPAKLRADRTSGAGHQHDPVAKPFTEAPAVEHDGIPAEQIIEFHVADRGEHRAPADQVFVRRHRQRFEAGVGADFGHAPAHAVGRRRQRDDHLAHAVLARPGRKIGDRSQHADVAQQPSVLGGVVVEKTDNPPLAAARELGSQARPCLAGADDQHRLPQRHEWAVEAVLLPYPVRKPVACHQEDEHDRVENEHAARQDGLQLQHDDHQWNQHRAKTRREHDPLQVDHAGESPQPAIQPEPQKDRSLQRQNPGQGPNHVGEIRDMRVEIEAQPVHREPCHTRGGDVMGEGQPGPPVLMGFHVSARRLQ